MDDVTRRARRTVPERPVVPGFTVGRHLGAGAHGAVWSAVEDATGERLALKVGGSADATLDREAALLTRLDHPHLLALHRVVDLPDRRRALVLDLADGGDLAALLDARGPLAPGQVVTLLVPLAQALAHLHDHGLVHADLAPANVLLSGDGRPLLADLGVARLLGVPAEPALAHEAFCAPEVLAGAGATPASDVYALGALGRAALDPAPDGRPHGDVETAAVRAVLSACLADDPAMRPHAAAVAARLWPAAQATALPRSAAATAHDPSDDITRRVRVAAEQAQKVVGDVGRHRRLRRPSRRVLVAAAVGATVASVLAGGGLTVAALRARDDGVAGAAHGGGQGHAVSVVRVVEVLAQRRAAALESGDPGRLAAVEVAGSPAAQADSGLLDRLSRSGQRLDGVRYTLADVRLVRADPASAVVRATVTTGAHRRLDADGVAVAVVPASAPEHVELVLAAGDGAAGWLLQEVRPAG